jgi:integrase
MHTAVMACWKHARLGGWVDGEPWARQRLPRVPVSAGLIPTAHDVRALLAAAESGVEALWLRLHFVTGARPDEVVALRWSAFDLERDTVTLYSPKTSMSHERARHRDGVDGAELAAPPAKAVDGVRCPLDDDPVLISSDAASARVWTVNYAGSFRWPALRRRARVSDDLRLYDLRHAMITSLQRAGLAAGAASARAGNSPTTALSRLHPRQPSRRRARRPGHGQSPRRLICGSTLVKE